MTLSSPKPPEKWLSVETAVTTLTLLWVHGVEGKDRTIPEL